MSSTGIMVLRLGKDNLCRGEGWVRLGVLEGSSTNPNYVATKLEDKLCHNKVYYVVTKPKTNFAAAKFFCHNRVFLCRNKVLLS